MSQNKIKAIYNTLSKLEGKLNRVTKKSTSYPIHKKLNLPNGIDIYDWIGDLIIRKPDINILDAGCGVGYGLIQLVKNLKATGLGISLSDHEITLAQTNASLQGVNDICKFEMLSFDRSFDKKFDVVIAVESLKHSSNVSKTVSNLFQTLQKNGKLIVVDDFFLNPDLSNNYTRAYLQKWSVQKLYTQEDYLSALPESADLKVHELDSFLFKSKPLSKKAGYRVLSVLDSISELFSNGNIFGIYKAGLALDLLYHNGLVSYKILEITKN